MKLRVCFTFSIVLLLGCLLTDMALGAEGNTITVTGTAKVTRKADIAFLTLYVKGEGILMTDASRNAEEKSRAIQKTLKDSHKEIKGIEVSDIQIGEKKTQFFSSDQRDVPPRPEIVKRVRITIPPDPALAYQVIDTAIRAGAVMETPSSTHYPEEFNSVIIYGLLDASGAEGEAKQKAFENAGIEVNKMAALAGKKAGGVSSVGCGGELSLPQQIFLSGRQTSFPAKYVGIEPDGIAVSASVMITFELLGE